MKTAKPTLYASSADPDGLRGLIRRFYAGNQSADFDDSAEQPIPVTIAGRPVGTHVEYRGGRWRFVKLGF